MSLYGRRRCILSGSDVTTITHMLNTHPEFSASYHSTSSCNIDGMVYYDYDCQDIDQTASISKLAAISSSYFVDHSYSVMPNYPVQDNSAPSDITKL